MAPLFHHLVVIVSLVVGQSATAAGPVSAHRSFAFVPPSERVRISSVTRQPCQRAHHVWQLYGKKKAASAASKTSKIQVKLLQTVEGTGRAGEVILVSPSFFENKLKRSGSAVKISDEEVRQEEAQAAAEAQQEREVAKQWQERIADTTMTLKRKAGPDGQLFGAVNLKVILQELKNRFRSADEAENVARLKIVALKNAQDGKAIKHDIKKTGEYVATVALGKDVDAKFKIQVVPE